MTALSDLPIKFFQADFSVITVEPNDTLVITARAKLSYDAIEQIRETMARTFPGRKVIVLDDGLQMGILREQDGAS